MKKQLISGYILVHKPVGPSSFDAVAHIRRLLPPATKVGHAGTLDPFAQGLLLIGMGREATAHFKELALLDKTYQAQGELGVLTDTLDCTGTVLTHQQSRIPSQQQLLNAMQSLGSSYNQAPPLFSALKFKGKRLYALAREGTMCLQELYAIADLKKRVVDILSLTLTDYSTPLFTIEARVSHGTYIRSLVNDIARLAESCATTQALTRIAIGPLHISNAISLDKLTSLQALQDNAIATPTLLEMIKNYTRAHHKAAFKARFQARQARLQK